MPCGRPRLLRAPLVQDRGQVCGAGLDECPAAGGLHVEPQQVLGVGGAQVKPPVAKIARQPVGAVHRGGVWLKAAAHGRDRGALVGDPEINLAARGEFGAHFGDGLGQRLARLVEVLCDQHPGDHAAVAVVEVAEVVVRGELAAVGRATSAHCRLDKGVARLRLHWHAAACLNRLAHGVDHARVVDN